jgi:hypothetical protein
MIERGGNSDMGKRQRLALNWRLQRPESKRGAQGQERERVNAGGKQSEAYMSGKREYVGSLNGIAEHKVE